MLNVNKPHNVQVSLAIKQLLFGVRLVRPLHALRLIRCMFLLKECFRVVVLILTCFLEMF